MNHPRLLDTFTGRLRLEGTLTTRTGLHIGAGGSGDPLSTDSPVVRDAAGQPFIPGASLKGVLRSAAEALLRQAPLPLPNGGKLWTCEIFGGDGDQCISHQRLQEIRDQFKTKDGEKKKGTPRDVARTVWKESCTICRLFGSLALASRVRFPDLPLDGPPPRFEIRNGVGIHRDRGVAAPKVLYDFEAVPPTTDFRLTVIFDNYHDAEVGLVLYLLEQLHQGNLALGGKGSRGLGLVRLRWNEAVETHLASTNPFASMLSAKRLLGAIEEEADAAEAGADAEVASQPELPLPKTGNRDDWKTLGKILQTMTGTIDKSSLGQQASEAGLPKHQLNDRLELGLPDKKAKKPWDRVLEIFATHGWLVQKGEGYARAGEDHSDEEAGEGAQDPQLRQQQQQQRQRHLQQQALFDRFTGAMYNLWEEGYQCSAST